jgi:galactokinase
MISRMQAAQRRAEISQAFRSRFNDEPSLWVRAPGRVDLMGSHTDYNDGFVLTLSIDRDTWIAARRRRDSQATIFSLNLGESCSFDTSDPLANRIDGWGIYLQGVALVLQDSGHPVGGFDAIVHGTVPIGSGLSSSASLEAAMATLVEQLGGFEIEPVLKAKLCQRAENEIVGVNCGLLDQYTAILGDEAAAVVLDCRHLTHRLAKLPSDIDVVICNTCVPRQLSESAYGERRADCEQGATAFAAYDTDVSALRDVPLELFEEHEQELDSTVAKRCRFIIEENQRVLALADALSGNDRSGIASLTAASFAGARDQFEIGVPGMQSMIDAILSAPGAIGARQAGAGFGGCMVAFVDTNYVDEFTVSAADSYTQATGIAPEIYPVRPAAGAGLLE